MDMQLEFLRHLDTWCTATDNFLAAATAVSAFSPTSSYPALSMELVYHRRYSSARLDAFITWIDDMWAFVPCRGVDSK
jgi:hypothetical protein